MDTTLVTPIIAGSFGIVVAIIGGLIAFRGKKADHEPSVSTSWREADRFRIAYWDLYDMFRALRSAFRGYVARVKAGGDTALDVRELAALELVPPPVDGKVDA